MQSSRTLTDAGLRSLHDAMQGYVDRAEIPGIVTLVARGGDVHVDALGVMDLETREPMRRDAIFRIASMTKPVTGVAALMLVEDGALSLDDPVERWLPELADRRVLRRIDGPVDDTVPATRAITVRDLMTMRAGYGAVMSPDQYPIQQVLAERGLSPGTELSALHPDVWLGRFADVPLLHQPGEEWHYDTSFDILGVLVARVTGGALPRFLQERIFGPLEMRDTGFFVPEAALDRLPTSYTADDASGALRVMDPARGGIYAAPPVFASGAGGLVSTVDDYLILARMLLGGGEVFGTRLLTTASVAEMTRDHLTRAHKDRSPFFPGFWDHAGWGYGVEVTVSPDEVSPVPGRYGWDGGFGTGWRTHPATGMIAMVMCQRVFAEPVLRMQDEFFRGAFAQG